MLFNSAEVLAQTANSFFRRLPQPVDFNRLVKEQICPEVILALRALAADPTRVIFAADIEEYQRMGGRYDPDNTLGSSPIRSQRPYQTSTLR